MNKNKPLKIVRRVRTAHPTLWLVNAAQTLKQTSEVMQAALERDAKTWAEVMRVTGVKLN